jgi:ABC-2 type transport system ATP-binding protein
MEKILVVDGVTKEYPGRVAVDAASFEVTQGSIHGFLGPNGAGKSTTMRMIAGLLTPTRGQISLFGKPVVAGDLERRNLLGLLPENPPLFVDMTVEDYLRYVARLHRVKRPREQVERVLRELFLLDVRGRLIGNLSKGYKQRVGLAQAIVYDAPFLILDEPTNGLDPQAVVELREFIRQLAREKTILFSSHILSEVEQICDHITIIHQGRVRASGDLASIHRKFRQGLVLRLGLRAGVELPDLSRFGKYDVGSRVQTGGEDQWHISFDSETDIRGALVSDLVQRGIEVLTIQTEPPELEDIFLHMTESGR